MDDDQKTVKSKGEERCKWYMYCCPKAERRETFTLLNVEREICTNKITTDVFRKTEVYLSVVNLNTEDK